MPSLSQPKPRPPVTSGDRIRNARLAKEMTQSELATAIGITETSIIYIEGNKTKASLPTLHAISDVLGQSIHYLGVFEGLPESTFGQRLRKARHYRGLTKLEAAEFLGIEAKTLWGWESGIHSPLKQYKVKLESFISILH